MISHIALVTGATGALGAVVAHHALAAGYRVVITGRRQSALDELLTDLGADASQVMAIAADLTESEQVAGLVERVQTAWGAFQVLLNCAGGYRGGKRLAEVTDKSWDLMRNMNLRSAFIVSRAVLPGMVASGWGRIILVGSKAAVEPGARVAGYNVSKAGLVALAKSIAADYGSQGITANAILPSIIDTPNNRQMMPKGDPTKWVTPEEIAETMLFLARNDMRSINGALIPMYGMV